MALGIVAGQQPGVDRRLLPTRLAVLTIVIAAGFVFDDTAAPISDPMPSPLRWRRLVRASVAILLSSLLLTLVLPFAADDMDLVITVSPSEGLEAQAPPFPWGRLTLEMATMIGFVLAIAATSARRGQAEPGRFAVGVFLGVYAVAWLIPESHNPWASPEDLRWNTSANWWWLGFAVLWISTAALSWDSRVGWRASRPLRLLDRLRERDSVGSRTASG